MPKSTSRRALHVIVDDTRHVVSMNRPPHSTADWLKLLALILK